MRAIVYLIVLAIVGVGTMCAETTTRPTGTRPGEAEVKGWIGQLGSEKYAEREAAQRELEKLGWEMVPALKAAATQTGDGEIKMRLGRVVEAIEERDALQPTLITADFKEATIEQVARVLSAQTGVMFEVGKAEEGAKADARLTLRLEKKPFWGAMAAISEKMPVRLDDGQLGAERKGKVVLSHSVRNELKGMVDREGYAYVVDSLTRRQTVMMEGPQDQMQRGMITVEGRILLDPRWRVAVVKPTMVTDDVDDTGKHLAVMASAPCTASLVAPIGISLIRPAGVGKRLEQLRGAFVFDVALRTDVKTVENLEAAEIVRIGSAEVRLSKVQIAGGTLRVTVGTQAFGEMGTGPDGGTGGSVEPAAVTLTFTDAKGTKEEVRVLVSSRRGSTTYGFQKDEPWVKPVALRVEAVTKVKTVSVPFELKGLPLP